MWLTTAVAQAQGDAPGVTAATVQQVGKPVVTQGAAAVSSGAATVQHAASTSSAVPQRTVASAKAASQPAHKPAPAVTLPSVDVPAPPPPIAVATLPQPPVEVSPAAVAQPPADVPEADAVLAAVPAAVASTALAAEAIANGIGDESTVDEAAAVADVASTESVEPLARDAIAAVSAVPHVVALPSPQVGSLIETVFDTQAAGADVAPLEAAANAIVTSAVQGGLDGLPITSSVEQVVAIVDSAAAEPSEPKTPAAAPREPTAPNGQDESMAQILPSTPIAPSTTSEPIAQEGDQPSGSIASFETQHQNTEIVPSAAQPGRAASFDEQAPIAMSTPSQWAILGPAQGLRVAPRSSFDRPEWFGPGESPFAPPVLMVAPNAAPGYNLRTTGPAHSIPSPFEALAPPGAASPAPAQSSPSTVLGSSGNSPGAVSPFQLSLLPFTAWRTLSRQGSGHPASIVLPNLAPPG